MHTLGIQALTIRQAKQRLNDVFSDLRSARIPGDAKLVSAASYFYIEAAFDLAYVLVELSAEIGKTVVIGGFQDQVPGNCYGVQGLKLCPLLQPCIHSKPTLLETTWEVKKFTNWRTNRLSHRSIVDQSAT